MGKEIWIRNGGGGRKSGRGKVSATHSQMFLHFYCKSRCGSVSHWSASTHTHTTRTFFHSAENSWQSYYQMVILWYFDIYHGTQWLAYSYSIPWTVFCTIPQRISMNLMVLPGTLSKAKRNMHYRSTSINHCYIVFFYPYKKYCSNMTDRISDCNIVVI